MIHANTLFANTNPMQTLLFLCNYNSKLVFRIQLKIQIHQSRTIVFCLIAKCYIIIKHHLQMVTEEFSDRHTDKLTYLTHSQKWFSVLYYTINNEFSVIFHAKLLQ